MECCFGVWEWDVLRGLGECTLGLFSIGEWVSGVIFVGWFIGSRVAGRGVLRVSNTSID